MDADMYARLTENWAEVISSPSEREDLAAALESYDFSDQSSEVQDGVDLVIGQLRDEGYVSENFPLQVLTGGIEIVACE